MKRFKPGVSFGDFVVSDMKTSKSKLGNEKKRDYRRGWLLWLGVMIAVVVLIVRLASLQIFYGERYKVLANQNRIKVIKLPAPRGVVYDRNGEVLAKNVPVVVDRDGNKIESWKREYPTGDVSSAVVGYVGEVGADEVGILKQSGGKYDPGDMIGRSGLESWYEDDLRGVDGGRLVEVDNRLVEVREMGKKLPVSGKYLKLTLDANLQKIAAEALRGKKGAVVASDPRTGEVLVLVSAPLFDPVDVSKSLLDPDLPLFNRAIGGSYPPGSTFKMATTIAAIESGKVKPDFTWNDEGIIKVGDYSYTNWLFTSRGRTEGVVDFAKAIARSTDTFFYKVGEAMGPEIMSEWAIRMGLARKTGVDLPGEIAGTMATPQFLGETFQMAIGQGNTLTTPIQVNFMTNAIATEGKKCKLHFILGVREDCELVNVNAKTWKIVKEGMIGACSPGGTAFPLFNFLPKVACKTGTAEYVASTGKIRTHGWLTAYAPADDPKISVTVLVEGGGEGSNSAAPVVRKILAKFFNVADNYNYAAIPSGEGE